MYAMSRLITVLILSVFISACSSLPQTLESDNKNLITDYQQWLKSPSDGKNEVRLGGIIASVTNLEQSTRIEVVNMPISRSGKPDLNREPSGRYVGYIDGYAESMAFAPGRLVTLLGVSDGSEESMVGDYEMTVRVMKVTGYHLWRVEETIIINDIESKLSPCYGLYCRGSGLPSRGRVIQEVK